MPDHLITITGTVQGVGFRPFVARVATRLGVDGWVRNDLHGVEIRARSQEETLAILLRTIELEPPPAARIDSIAARVVADTEPLPPVDGTFAILPSTGESGPATVSATPDLALCDDCRRELLDPRNRRHGYAFTNCTNCGPRYSILLELPYDRPHTTMRVFKMCPVCGHEFEDPTDRRYHAQPNACPACGPQVELLASTGDRVATRGDAIEQAAQALHAGRIVAVKGIGGFHLLVDATNQPAVDELRRRKHREDKPFAVMFPSLEMLRSHVDAAPATEALLTGAAAPIVLLPRRSESAIATSVAPANPFLGALLPYSPLHLLLLRQTGRPVVATSANLSEEPLCIDNDEALERLRGIADLFLVHDRPIAHPVDDSVIRPAANNPPLVLRRARGLAPGELPLPDFARGGEPLLCVGGQMKNTVSLATASAVVVGPHIGDLATVASQQAFERNIDWLVSLFRTHPRRIVCDAHPDYNSTRYARASGLPVTTVQHHLAHILACLLEHDGGPDQVLGVSWDGTGYGSDGTIWGGEFILVDRRTRTAERVAHLRPFLLPGGEAAVRDPRRSALGLLRELGAAPADTVAHRLGFSPAETANLGTLLARRINSPVATSAGRLFDGVSALLGLASANSFEGQAAMQLEFAAESAPAGDDSALPFDIAPAATGDRLEIDWRPAVAALLAQQRAADAPTLSARFHRGLAETIAMVARKIGVGTVALSGGCFQNLRLLTRTRQALTNAGFTALCHRSLPPNDGNLSAGQAFAARLGITEVR